MSRASRFGVGTVLLGLALAFIVGVGWEVLAA